jgi:hypothetical protein
MARVKGAKNRSLALSVQEREAEEGKQLEEKPEGTRKTRRDSISGKGPSMKMMPKRKEGPLGVLTEASHPCRREGCGKSGEGPSQL